MPQKELKVIVFNGPKTQSGLKNWFLIGQSHKVSQCQLAYAFKFVEINTPPNRHKTQSKWKSVTFNWSKTQSGFKADAVNGSKSKPHREVKGVTCNWIDHPPNNF
jgi:hypothetical protein